MAPSDREVIGANGGPPIEEPRPETRLSAKIKLVRIQRILERPDLTSAQKCIGIGIVTAAATNGDSEVSTKLLQAFSSAKDRETVFRATKKLAEVKLIERVSVRGQAGRYRVLPDEVVEAVAAAFEERQRQSGRVKPDGIISDDPSHGTPEVVGFMPTTLESGPVKPDRSEPTTPESGRVEPVGFNPTPSDAHIENAGARADYLNNYNIYNKPTNSESKDRGYGGKEIAVTGELKLAETPKPEPETAVVATLLQKLVDIAETDRRLEEQPERRKRLRTTEEDHSDVTPTQVLEAFSLYNEMALRSALSQAVSLTPERKKKIRARISEHGGVDAWKTAMANIERSAFLRGKNDRGWRADLDFVLQPSSFTRLVEGGYGNGAHADDANHPEETPQQRNRRIMAEAVAQEKRRGY
jgi:hypothetical protein